MTQTQEQTPDQTTEQEKKGRTDLGPLGNAVSDRVEDLMRGYQADRPDAVAALARLRGGAGRSFGDCPGLWGLTVDTQDYEALWDCPRRTGGLPWNEDREKAAQEAVHAALTLFALHQQSLRDPSPKKGKAAEPPSGEGPAEVPEGHDASERTNWMHRRVRRRNGGRLPDHGLGWAVRACMRVGEIDPALHNRLKKAAQATAFGTRVGELRQIIARLRKEKIALDYGLLAEQLFTAQQPGGATAVRDAWGHGFVSYRHPKKNKTTADNPGDSAPETPETPETPDKENQ